MSTTELKDLNDFLKAKGVLYAPGLYVYGSVPGEEFPGDPAFVQICDVRGDPSGEGPIHVRDAVFSFEPMPKLPRGKRRNSWRKATEKVVVECAAGASDEEKLRLLRDAINEHFSFGGQFVVGGQAGE